jgi:hypothetical protein
LTGRLPKRFVGNLKTAGFVLLAGVGLVLVLLRHGHEYMEWLEEHCNIIFEQALDGWWTDKRSWPPDRSISVFQKWFDCCLYSMVLDLDDQPL